MKTMLFNPYTGTPRHPSDIASDPEGILLLDPDEPVKAAPTAIKPPQASQPAQDAVDAARWRAFLSTRSANTHEVINQAIDAAIAAQKGQP